MPAVADKVSNDTNPRVFAHLNNYAVVLFVCIYLLPLPDVHFFLAQVKPRNMYVSFPHPHLSPLWADKLHRIEEGGYQVHSQGHAS